MIFVGSTTRFSPPEQIAIREAAVVAGFDPNRCAVTWAEDRSELLVVGCRSDFRADGEFSVWHVSLEALRFQVLSRIRTTATPPLDPGVGRGIVGS